MGKPFKDKLKNVGDFISGTIAEVEKQAKDSEVLDKISKGTKDGLVFVSNGVKDGAEKITNGAKTSADTIKNVVAEHKKQGTQDDNKEKQGSLDDQLHDAVNRYNAAYAEFENNGSAILIQRERSMDLLENVENLINTGICHSGKQYCKKRTVKIFRSWIVRGRKSNCVGTDEWITGYIYRW